MAFNNVPVNGWPQIKPLGELDALAKKLDNMPVFSSTDRDWLDEWESKLPELPADPETDGVKVLTATTESGETVKSWEEPASGGVNYSTTEQNTGVKWIDGKDIYFITIEFTSLAVASNTWVDTGVTSGAETIVGGFAIASAGGALYQVNISPDLSSTGHFGVLQTRSTDITIGSLCAYYTKPTAAQQTRKRGK